MTAEEHRLITLETRVAFQDDELRRLKELYGAHQQQLYRLEILLEQLLQRMQTLQETATDRPGNERPPHY
jgi:uncharacterized coiled-coil protein SlyX